MPVPDYQTLMLPVLKLINQGHATVRDCIAPIAEDFELSQEDLNEMLPSGKQTLISNRIHWARHYMAQAGLVEAAKRGHFQTTGLGKKVLSAPPTRIDNKFLGEFSGFKAFLDRSKPKNHSETSNAPLEQQINLKTPEQEIDSAAIQIEDALAKELLQAVAGLSPSRFERLVVDLLLAMGYGGGDLERGLQTSLSGDGGIDGIINEDELGLDAVYVQAKRYATDNKVGRPALNAFVGSLTGEGATKGVFVTTSDFSRDAMDYVARVQQRIVLINGDRLARLMIKHEVGVRPRRTYVLRSVDEDYFSDT
ncbi:restriction endonuclease [Sedimentitalea sp. JM2-8]|uniref:Restriction endonuclease n=1 Tax=Sedimentitalea xiamensis TaxID=3050037 RepID=A0ABT7FJ87_9RHOB|nr:restriction endonuclease [Sedimentitalea xiamensis]MDK3075050.1 restriction endonuclease [Sedimentitalea xiamensis]